MKEGKTVQDGTDGAECVYVAGKILEIFKDIHW